MMNRTEFLTVDELIERWQGIVCKGTLANWRSNSKGPCYMKLGSKVIYPIDCIKEFEKQSINETKKAG